MGHMPMSSGATKFIANAVVDRVTVASKCRVDLWLEQKCEAEGGSVGLGTTGNAISNVRLVMIMEYATF